jgi:hypothetical protein
MTALAVATGRVAALERLLCSTHENSVRAYQYGGRDLTYDTKENDMTMSKLARRASICAVALAAAALAGPTGVADATTPGGTITTTTSPAVASSTVLPGTVTSQQAPTAAPNVAGGCSDYAIAGGTIWANPNGSGTNFGTFGSGANFTLSCYYYNNTDQGKWYAETKNTYGSNHNKYGYIWVQRLYWGSQHLCLDPAGLVDSITYNSLDCPLIDYTIDVTTP